MVVLLEGGGEAKGWGFLVWYNDAREVGGGGFGKSWELFFNSDEGGGVIEVLTH